MHTNAGFLQLSKHVFTGNDASDLEYFPLLSLACKQTTLESESSVYRTRAQVERNRVALHKTGLPDTTIQSCRRREKIKIYSGVGAGVGIRTGKGARGPVGRRWKGAVHTPTSDKQRQQSDTDNPAYPTSFSTAGRVGRVEFKRLQAIC